MIKYKNGIEIEGLDFVLDGNRSCDCSFVSHAHTDHARRHKRIIATAETALLYKQRFPDVPTRVLPLGRKVKLGAASVELFAAGHMLGSAQILVEVNKTKIVYTGDFKVYRNFTCPPLEVRQCDILIMESTYGDPAYSFPPQNEVYTKIISFVKRAQDEKYLPVLVGYAMGKTQEAVFLLQKHGYTVFVDTSVSKINQLYRTAGIKLQPTSLFHEADLENSVLVVSPQSLRSDEFRTLRRKRSLFLSGWSVGSKRKYNFGTDLSVPLSDHADFNQLLQYIKECSPKKIYTLHGEPRFAQILRELGYDAEYLDKETKSASPKKRAARVLATEESLPSSIAPQDHVSEGENYELF